MDKLVMIRIPVDDDGTGPVKFILGEALSRDCARAKSCVCGFCKGQGMCDFGDCRRMANVPDPVKGGRVCPWHYGSMGIYHQGRIVWPEFGTAPAPCVGDVLAYRSAWSSYLI